MMTNEIEEGKKNKHFISSSSHPTRTATITTRENLSAKSCTILANHFDPALYMTVIFTDESRFIFSGHVTTPNI